MAAGVRQQQAERTGAELKAAAVRVFARLGYLNTKITDITAEAGRAAGSFYKHYANKEALLEALLADLLAVSDGYAGDPRHSDDFSEREAVRYHIALYWHFRKRNHVLLDALQQAATVDPVFAGRVRELMEPDLHHMADHLIKARAAGVRLTGEPLVLASLFSALVPALAGALQAGGSSPAGGLSPAGGSSPAGGLSLSDDEAIETLTSFFYAGIGAGGARP